jgi:hypothetical protein
VTAPRDTRPAAFGYLLVVEDDLHGYTGGLLVVCDRGRPLEFHCTEPVQPSRAQQILFGPTLRDFVCGEQIGGALVGKCKLPLSLLLVLDEPTAGAGRAAGIETIVLSVESLNDMPINVALPESLTALAEAIDPAEPFERVREAIREAQRLVTGSDERAAA